MRSFLLVALATALASAQNEAAAQDHAEFRGMWVSRFDWVSADPERCKANIAEIFASLAEANFNAALFQVRGAAETLYPSELEPWSPLIGGKSPGFDPVALAIETAHRHGIAFHAYINPMPLRPSGDSSPPDRDHLFARHGPDSPEPWICVDRQGKPATQDYYYLSAGIPSVHAYLRKVILDFVRRYDIDGVHLDRIRYPGPQYSHDPVSRLRFVERGNPLLLDWSDWRRHQLDKLVNDLAAEIRAEKPEVVLSCAAWGIYDRYHVDGYGNFSSGYHDYFQDTWNWCRLGAMDALVPMIYWNLADPKPNYDELLADFIRGIGARHFIGGQRVFSTDENVKEIALTRDAGALGTVLWSYRSARRRGVLQGVHNELYRDKAKLPVIDRLQNPRLGVVLGKVVAEDGEPLLDARVSLEPVEGSRRNGVYSRAWTSGADALAFLDVPPGEVRVVARYHGAPTTQSDAVRVDPGRVSQTELVVSGSSRARAEPFLTILRPRGDLRTTRSVLHVLGRTRQAQRVTVGSEDVEVFANGAFARDNIPLQLGENRIEVIATDGDLSATRSLVATRVEPQPEAPTTTLRIVEPSEELALLPGRLLTIHAEGPPGRVGQAELSPGIPDLPLTETRSADGQPTGTYTATTTIPSTVTGKRIRVRVSLRGSDDAPSLQAESEAIVSVWDPRRLLVAETTSERTGITYGLHSVRLGGPWIAWVPAGTRFEVIGKRGRNLQVRLSESMTGWVSLRQSRFLPDGTAVPHNYFTSCHVSGNEDHDTLAIALRAPIAVAVRSETVPTNRLYLDFFNTHNALTWNSRKSTASVIGAVRSEQIEPDRLRLTVPLRSKQIWGYWTEYTGNSIVLHVRRPPVIAAAPKSPLADLTFALEAGHGGSNSGAVGNLGTKEKSINLAAATALQRELEARGARVVQVRRGDESPGLQQRVERVNEADADFLVSMHANSASTSRGFLRVSGTSTYYHDVHCQLAAELVYEQLLTLGWDEFGVVGDFSYTPLRNTRVPAILVEQAFMSHPGDEARLLDPEYQKRQATAIADGLAAFFDHARE